MHAHARIVISGCGQVARYGTHEPDLRIANATRRIKRSNDEFRGNENYGERYASFLYGQVLTNNC